MPAAAMTPTLRTVFITACLGAPSSVLTRALKVNGEARHMVSDCDGMQAADVSSDWGRMQRQAASALCATPLHRMYMESWVDPRFLGNYRKTYGSDGWIEEAWVNYFKAMPNSIDFMRLTDGLIESIHRFSSRPIVLVNFGAADAHFDPERFPRLVLLQARDVSKLGVSFNFNKFQAALLSKVKVGVSLDSDMMMATPMADSLFTRSREEITEAYPYPMLPVHFLDRDPVNLKDYDGTGNYLVYQCDGCPKPTMRWGQAQPTWTFWSLPFLGRWQASKLNSSRRQGVNTANIGEDEDLLNVALWTEGASKQWCMWQPGGVGFVSDNLYSEHSPGPHFNADRSRYVKGTPIAYYFGHAEKTPKKVEAALSFLESMKSKPVPKVYFYDEKFYTEFTELAKANPEVPHLCIL
mmetsp:Transcript_109547/g.212092  ORF Transcript_109547/g.212092 Transcript_109547/m.212092 type:complete len:409 (-) Transcript_109547:57-1283(-)